MYTTVVKIQRTIVETYECSVEAEDPEEALDLCYEEFSEYPNNTGLLDKRLRVDEETVSVDIISTEHKRESMVVNDQND